MGSSLPAQAEALVESCIGALAGIEGGPIPAESITVRWVMVVDSALSTGAREVVAMYPGGATPWEVQGLLAWASENVETAEEVEDE